MDANISPVAKRLMVVRGLRSMGQGAMVVDLTLYLSSLHWSATSIGSVLSAGGVFGAVLILAVGFLSDRYGRKNFLLVYEGMTLLCALLSIWYTNWVFLALAIIITGFGRGQSGGAGPFAPAEQAWLARYVPRPDRGRVYSLNSAVGFLGMAVGAVGGGATGLWEKSSPGYLAYRPVFAAVAVLSLICMLVLLSIPEDKAGHNEQVERQAVDETASLQSESSIRRQENTAMAKMALINVLNGLAIGLTGPMMSYWFAARYHVSTAAIGSTMATAFLLTSFASVFNAMLAARLGMVTAVTSVRILGVVLMLFLPLAPNFSIAAVIYVARSALNRSTQGARSALSASLTRDERRGVSTTINAFSMRITSSIGPTISGYLLDMGQFALPFYITAGLQLAYAVAYQKIFHAYEGNLQAE